MKSLLIGISIVGLALTIVPALLEFNQAITMATHKHLMLVGMVLWFITAPLWIKEKQEVEPEA